MPRQNLSPPRAKKPARQHRSPLHALAKYDVRASKPAEVNRYLTRYPDLGRLLPQIGAKVRSELGPSVELSIELYKDRESDDRFLALFVRSNEYDRQFVDEIEEVRSLFDDQLSKTPGELLIGTDFRRPRGANAL